MKRISALIFSFFLIFFSASSIHANQNTPQSYIVVLQDNLTRPQQVANELARVHNLSLDHVYTHALNGFSARIPEPRLSQLQNDPRVKYISLDREVSISGKPASAGKPSPTPQPQVVPTGIRRIFANDFFNTGAGVGVAVIDTGIDLKHPDLAATDGINCVNSRKNSNDDNGHGSHVAGTIAALNDAWGVVGVAPDANLFSVKVLNSAGSGTWSSVICGIEWMTANAQSKNIQVANMSLGGGGSSDEDCGQTNNDALHEAICNSSTAPADVTYVVAAGNEADDANNHVPAAYNDTVITVSAFVDTDGLTGGLGNSTGYGADDTFASFSNFGSPVDIAAPGVNIYSTWKGGSYKTISGTSMATPHVSGAAALYFDAYPGNSWTQARDYLVSHGNTIPGFPLHPEPVLNVSSL